MVSQVRRSVQLPGPGPKATLAGLPPVWWSGHPTWLLPALAWHQVLNTAPPERAPCAHHSPHHRGAPPWLEFGVCDGTVDKEHSPRGEAARAQLFLSVCGPPGSWSVYTKLQASRENLQPYHGILATLGLGRWGGMCVSLAPFPKETSGFM